MKIILFILLIIACGWWCVVYFDNWDILLTKKQWFMLEWKPEILFLICYLIIKFKYD